LGGPDLTATSGWLIRRAARRPAAGADRRILHEPGDASAPAHGARPQQIPRQLEQSRTRAGCAAVAVNALDSSSGPVLGSRRVREFVDEAVQKLARLHGDPQARPTFEAAPVVIAGYSAATTRPLRASDRRINQRVLASCCSAGFVRRDRQVRRLARQASAPRSFSPPMARPPAASMPSCSACLTDRGVGFARRLRRGLHPAADVLAVGDRHRPQQISCPGWAADPFRAALARIPDFARSGLLRHGKRK